MNIVQINVNNPYIGNLQEFIFRTNRPKEDFYDCNFNLTEFFKNWLIENKPDFYNDIEELGINDLMYYREESLEEIV